MRPWPPFEERFWARVEKTSTCWNWTGDDNGHGYGRIYYPNGKGSRVAAHRVAYQLLVGPIPDGLTLDHLCRNRSCVNPTHLEPVTVKENVLRGEGRTARQARQTHCKRGHPFSGHNLRVTATGERRCRECARLRHYTPQRQAYLAANKEAINARQRRRYTAKRANA